MKNLLICFMLALASVAHADVTAMVGVGDGIMKGAGTPFERTVVLGYEHKFPVGAFVRPQVGYFLDVSGVNRSSFFGSGLVGIRTISPVGPMLHFAVGPAYLQNPDQILGGHFQFNLEFGIGMDDKNFSLEAVVSHLSSAGIEQPNRGRDFIGLEVCFKFNSK